MTSLTPKLELSVRRSGSYVILAGIVLTESFKAGDLAAMEMFGRVDGDKITIAINKAQYEPKNHFGESLAKEDLASIPTQEVWRKYQSSDPQEFGGVIVGRDNFLFDFECQETTSRMAVVSVIEDANNLLGVEEHAILRSQSGFETKDTYEFTLTSDTSENAMELISSFRGEGLLGMLRKPMYTLQDGTIYRINTTMPKLSNELHEQQYREILEHGEVTQETHQKMRDQWLTVHRDTDYIEYIKAMGEREPLVIAKFSRLLTEEDQAQINASSVAYLREFMGK